MGLFASFFHKAANRNQHPQNITSIMSIPGPVSPLTANREEELFQYVHAQLQKGIERSFNGREIIYIHLESDGGGMSSSFASNRKDTRWSEPLSLAEKIRLLAEIRHKVGVAGWRVVQCGLRGSRIHLQIQPAQKDNHSIPGPADIWPDITTYAQLMDVAVEDLTVEVTKYIISDGGVTVDFILEKEHLPASCLALPKERLQQVVVTVRNRLTDKWTVEKFDLDDDLKKKIHCALRWKESMTM